MQELFSHCRKMSSSHQTPLSIACEWMCRSFWSVKPRCLFNQRIFTVHILLTLVAFTYGIKWLFFYYEKYALNRAGCSELWETVVLHAHFACIDSQTQTTNRECGFDCVLIVGMWLSVTVWTNFLWEKAEEIMTGKWKTLLPCSADALLPISYIALHKHSLVSLINPHAFCSVTLGNCSVTLFLSQLTCKLFSSECNFSSLLSSLLNHLKMVKVNIFKLLVFFWTNGELWPHFNYLFLLRSWRWILFLTLHFSSDLFLQIFV